MKKNRNEWYEWSDGWFTYFVNTVTGEKKLELDDGDILVCPKLDDFVWSDRNEYEGY